MQIIRGDYKADDYELKKKLKETPGMMLIARKIFFYLFLLLYCIFCPILILYSFGYILNPVSKEISQSGLIHIETIPFGANIYLGKSHYKYKTPASITNLFPGSYNVTLKLKGYRLWSHTVLVEEGKASTFNNIILLPQDLNPRILLPQSNYQSLVVLPKADSFLLKKGSEVKDYFVFDWKNEVIQPLLERHTFDANFPISDIYPQIKGNKIIILGGSLWDKRFYLIDPEDRDNTVNEITKVFSGRPNAIIWDAAYPNNCFARYGGNIHLIDLKGMVVHSKFLENIKGFGIVDKWIYVLENDFRVSKMRLDETQRTILFEDSNSGKDIFRGSRFYDIQFLMENIFIFLGENGDLVITLAPSDIVQTRVLGIDFNKRSKRLLWWSKNTIEVADFNGKIAKDNLSSGRIKAETVHAQGKSISQCFWAHNGTHIIFKDKDRVFLLELLSNGKHHTEFITAIKNNSELFYSEETESLYYLDTKGRISVISLVPKENIISLLSKEPIGEGKR